MENSLPRDIPAKLNDDWFVLDERATLASLMTRIQAAASFPEGARRRRYVCRMTRLHSKP